MKKIIVLLLLLTLTGCGRKTCNYKFYDTLTKNYSEDALKCEKVTYVSNAYDFELVTTPNNAGDAFLAEIRYDGRKFIYSYPDVEFINAKIRKYEKQDIMFLELYTKSDNANVYLIVMDSVGNIKYEAPSTSSPVLDGENFIVREYLRFGDNKFLCSEYDSNDVLYRENTYNTISMNLVSSSDVKIKEICN